MQDVAFSRAMRLRRRLPYIVLAVVIVITTAGRIRLASMPLERDEGEYAYSAQLLLDGVPPFAASYTMKFPGVALAYVPILAILGHSDVAIRLGLAAMNVLTVAGVAWCAARLGGGRWGAAGAGSAYAALSISPAVQGTTANAEHFVLLFVVLGAVCLICLRPRPAAALLAGICLGTAVLMKQHAAVFVAWGAVHLVMDTPRPRRWTRWPAFAVGVGLPLVCMGLWLTLAGTFAGFWFWTFTYARSYVTSLPLAAGMAQLCRNGGRLCVHGFGVVALAVLGHWHPHRNRLANGWPVDVSLISLTGLATAAVVPGLYFRPHYFLLIVMPLSLWAGLGTREVLGFWVRHCSRRHARLIPVLAVVLQLGVVFVAGAGVLLAATPERACRALYGGNPFPEARAVGRWLRVHTPANSQIAVLGSEPQICFYARRRKASGFLYAYPLMEPHPAAADLQRQMIAEIETSAPAGAVFVGVPVSWLARRSSPRIILDWFDSYRERYYERVGVVTPQPDGTWTETWALEAAGRTDNGKPRLEVYLRHTDRRGTD